jgi:hypothetical protein
MVLNLFLITSVINPSNKPLSYTANRSIYTTEERFEQTLTTIESIRLKVPNAYIYLVDGSIISDHMTNKIKSVVDQYLNLSNNPTAMAEIDHPYKSRGEATEILYGLRSIPDNLQYDNLFKISGRYYLDDNFLLENYMNEHNIFQLCGDRYATTLYKIHKSHLPIYIQVLEWSMLHHMHLGMEVALFLNYPVNHSDNRYINKVGVTGLIAVFPNCPISN